MVYKALFLYSNMYSELATEIINFKMFESIVNYSGLRVHVLTLYVHDIHIYTDPIIYRKMNFMVVHLYVHTASYNVVHIL